VLAVVRLLVVALQSSLFRLLTLPAQCPLRPVPARCGLLRVILCNFGEFAPVPLDRSRY
jgi:hypothetical protein